MTRHYTIVLAALLLAAGIAVAGLIVSPGPARDCFPAASWGADQAKRPCAEVVKVFEDGSVRVRVFDADGNPRFFAGIGALDR